MYVRPGTPSSIVRRGVGRHLHLGSYVLVERANMGGIPDIIACRIFGPAPVNRGAFSEILPRRGRRNGINIGNLRSLKSPIEERATWT